MVDTVLVPVTDLTATVSLNISPIDKRVFAYTVIGGKVFKVDESYLDEPLDSVYPLYDHEDYEVGRMEARTIQQVGKVVPKCYSSLFAEKMRKAECDAFNSINILPVLRIIVNNERYMNYVLGPIVIEQFLSREAGQYFAYALVDGKPTLFGADTMLELHQTMKHGITLCQNRGLRVLHDIHFEEALAKLLTMFNANDICQPTQIHQFTKEVIEEDEESKHNFHCSWCVSLGLDGHHNHWNNDGKVYDSGSKTTHSDYIKGN